MRRAARSCRDFNGNGFADLVAAAPEEQ